MSTVTQVPLDRALQARISDDAFRRLRVVAAARGCSPGRVVNDLILETFPNVDKLLQR